MSYISNYFTQNVSANCSLPTQSVHTEHTPSAEHLLSMYLIRFPTIYAPSNESMNNVVMVKKTLSCPFSSQLQVGVDFQYLPGSPGSGHPDINASLTDIFT